MQAVVLRLRVVFGDRVQIVGLLGELSRRDERGVLGGYTVIAEFGGRTGNGEALELHFRYRVSPYVYCC
jgi:hypothetical protein